MAESPVSAPLALLRSCLEEWWEVAPLDDDAWSWSLLTQIGIPLATYAQVPAGMHALLWRSSMELPVPEAQRAAMAELVSRINGDMPTGAWVLDATSGRLRYKNGFFFGRQGLPRHMVMELIQSARVLLNRYVPALIHVYSGGTPEAAWALVGPQEPVQNDPAAFPAHINRYLGSLLMAAGLERPTADDVLAFRQYVEAACGSLYAFGAFDGVHRSARNESALRDLYARGALSIQASASAMSLTREFVAARLQ